MIHFKVLELSHRQQNDDKVEDDVASSGAPSVRVEIDALPVVLTVPAFPSKANRNTLQRSRYDEGDHVCDAEPYGKIDGLPKWLLREDAEVEE